MQEINQNLEDCCSELKRWLQTFCDPCTDTADPVGNRVNARDGRISSGLERDFPSFGINVWNGDVNLAGRAGTKRINESLTSERRSPDPLFHVLKIDHSTRRTITPAVGATIARVYVPEDRRHCKQKAVKKKSILDSTNKLRIWGISGVKMRGAYDQIINTPGRL